MKRRMAILVLAICALCTALAVAGCEEYEPESTESQAMAYYQEKYGEKVGVQDAHGLGDYALFGYSYSGMEYVMDDGVSVIYIDDEAAALSDPGVFAGIADYCEIRAGGQSFCLSHYPMLDWNKGDAYYAIHDPKAEAFMLHGHIHSRGQEVNAANARAGILRYDVGVDANGYCPVSIEKALGFFGGL